MDIFILRINDEKLKNLNLTEFCYKSFKQNKKCLEHSFMYFMLNKILMEKYNIQERKIEFIDNKPYLKNRELYLSLSHSKEYIALAFSKNDCGVDIEFIKDRDYKAISKRMNFESKTLKEFYKDWTKFEAEYKLGKKSKQIKTIEYNSYILTAVSENSEEDFQFYTQIKDCFSKLTV